MPRYNPKNERIKKDYFRWLKDADRKADSTIDAIRKAIARFEEYTGYKDLGTFNKEQAIGFKKHLASSRGARDGEPLAKSTMLSTTGALKEFFRWLGWQPGYKTRIKVTDIEYLNLSEKDTRAAKAPAFKTFPTLEQVHAAVRKMPAESEVERRDRAVIAMLALTGARDSALISFRLKHIDLDRRLVMQDPREVTTKRSKRIDTFFFPVGGELEAIVVDWVRYLREEKLYGNDDPVFPRTRVVPDADGGFAVAGLEREFWSNADAVRRIFRTAFARIELSGFRPHSIRDTLAQYGERNSPTIEHFKAWSQNLGHEHVATTLTSYGNISAHRQGELVLGMKGPDAIAVAEGDERQLIDQFLQWKKSNGG